MEKEIVSLKGIVETIIYRNEENSYTVLEMENDLELITVVGILPTINEGDEITVMGHYDSHRSFGMQFKAISWDISMPEGTVAIEKYLSGGSIKGIGPVIAKRIVEQFKEKTLDVIESNPELLSVVKGISYKRAKVISEDYSKMFGMRKVMLFLNKYNSPANIGVKMWQEYRSASVEIIKENPFVLTKRVIGLSFEEADKIRIDLGFEKDSQIRLEACVLSVLREVLKEGHSCYPLSDVVTRAGGKISVSNGQIEDTIENLLLKKEIYIKKISDVNFVYLDDIYAAEMYIATRLSMMMKTSIEINSSVSSEILELEAKNNINYAELQKTAIEEAVKNPASILTGGPGTGKTTTLNAIISIFKNREKKVAIAAPTGRAAKRISELTGYDAQTIHRLLGVNMNEDGLDSFIHNEENTLNCDVLIVDELSMVDMILFKNLLMALNFSCKLVLVGDKDQLPPVGVGNTLKELINSSVIPTVELTEIFRQALESDIVKNSHSIIAGEEFDLTKREGDFFYISKNNDEDISQLVLELMTQRLPKAYDYSSLWDIQILSPTRIGRVGTVELNKLIQEKINPTRGASSEIKYGHNYFRVGDKIMQIRNNYEVVWKDKTNNINEVGVFNGDIGQITMIDKVAGIFEVDYDEKTAVYQTSQINEIELAYAITVHKSQGSEFEAVILPISAYLGRMAYRNLLYTAVTRAKSLMVVVGSFGTINRMILNADKTSKYTNLSKLLKETYD